MNYICTNCGYQYQLFQLHMFTNSQHNFTDTEREEIKFFERETRICGTTARQFKNEERGTNEAICRYKDTNREDQRGNFWL